MITHYEMILDVCKGHEGTIFNAVKVKEMILHKFKEEISDPRLADYCYNRINNGIEFDKHIFVRNNQKKYKFVGENYAYTGNIYRKPIGKKERIVGKWENGEYRLFDDFLEDEFPDGIIYPDNIVGENIIEGAKKKIVVNSYERNPVARQMCLEEYGYDCRACGFNFEKKYGDIGKNFIHVHHTKPLSEIGEEYKVDPTDDLIPVCPNCHAMLHKTDPPYTIDELKNIINT